MDKILNKLKEQVAHCEEIRYPDVLVNTKEARAILDYIDTLKDYKDLDLDDYES